MPYRLEALLQSCAKRYVSGCSAEVLLNRITSPRSALRILFSRRVNRSIPLERPPENFTT